MPYTIEVRPGLVVEVADDIKPDDAAKKLAEQFPATGEDIARDLAENPDLDKQLTDEQFAKYRDYLAGKKTSAGKMLADAAQHLAGTVWQNAKASVMTNPLEAQMSVLEGAAQGTRNFYGMLAHSENPSGFFFDIKQRLAGNDTLGEQKAQWLQAREFGKQTQNLEQGKDGIFFDPQFTNQGIVGNTSLVADPTLLVPFAGQALKATTLGMKAATMAGKGFALFDRAALKGVELAAEGTRLASRPVVAAGEHAIGLGQRTLSAVAPGVSAAEARGIALGATGAGAVVSPLLAKAGAVYGVAKGVDAVAELAAHAARTAGGLPSRTGTLARLATDESLSTASRRLARAGATLEPVLDFAGAATKGAAEGAAIGGLLGYGNNRAEGGWQGVGAGLAMGSAGAVLGRAFARASGKLGSVESHGDVIRYAAKYPEIAPQIGDILAKHGPERTANILDTLEAARGHGVQIDLVRDGNQPWVAYDKKGNLVQTFATEAEGLNWQLSNPGYDLQHPRYKGAFFSVGGRDRIVLNTDLMKDTTAMHETEHALKSKLAAMGLADEFVSRMDPVVNKDDYLKLADRYLDDAKNLRVDEIQKARQIIESGEGDINWAKRTIADEFSAAYAEAWIKNKPTNYLLQGQRSLFRQAFDIVEARWKDRMAVDAKAGGWDFSQGIEQAMAPGGKRQRIAGLDAALERAFKQKPIREGKPVNVTGMPLDQAAKILRVAGAEHLLKTDANGNVAGIKTGKELAAETATLHDDIVNRLSALPADKRLTESITDAKGRVTIRGSKLSPEEIAAIAESPFISPSALENLKTIGAGLENPDGLPIYRIVNWKSYGESKSGKKVAGVYPVSERLGLIYGIEANSEAGLYARVLDVSKVQERLLAAMKLPEYKGLYPDFASAWKDLTGKLLPNYDRPDALPGAQALGGGEAGVAKRNLFYEALGTVPRTKVNPTMLANATRPGYYPSRKGGHTFESMRIERVSSITDTGAKAPFSEARAYERAITNFSPEPVRQRRVAQEFADVRYSPHDRNEDVVRVAKTILVNAGQNPKRLHSGYAPLDIDYGKRLADWFDTQQHAPRDPRVRADYGELTRQLGQQYRALEQAGYKIEPWTQEGQPYATSEDMIRDVRDNKHLHFFLTDQGFGSTAVAEHPLLEKSGISINGRELLWNDVLRGVHDLFGHAAEGYQFGPRGEYNAFLTHASMFEGNAVNALAAETLVQNSWFNYGRHMRDAKGRVLEPGEAGYKPPQDRSYADQKALHVPDQLLPVGVKGNRYRIGLTTFTTPDAYAPQAQQAARNEMLRSIRKLDRLYDARAELTNGEYRETVEPTLDIEFVTHTDTDISPVAAKAIELAQKHNQQDVLIMQVVEPTHPNARTSIDIGFTKPATPEQIRAIQQMFSDNGIHGWTLSKDRKGNTVHMISAYVPEFSGHLDMATFRREMVSWTERVRTAAGQISQDNIAYKQEGFVSATTIHRLEYGKISPRVVLGDSVEAQLGRRRVVQAELDRLQSATARPQDGLHQNDPAAGAGKGPSRTGSPQPPRLGQAQFSPDSFSPEELPNGTAHSHPSGYRIIQKQGGAYRLYAPDGSLAGVHASQQKAAAAAGKLENKTRFAPDTPAFKRWFGDSKVVDEHGQPLVVYHGGKRFNEFKGDYVFAAKDIDTAASFAEQYAPEKAEIKPLYLRLERPLDLTDPATSLQWYGEDHTTGPFFSAESNMAAHFKEDPAMFARAKQAGYDGIIYHSQKLRNASGGIGYIFWKSDQAKLAGNPFVDPKWGPTAIRSDTNNGQFDPKNPDIRFSPAQHDTPEFKRWFGKSQVVDEQGQPLVVYHGTGHDFSKFDNQMSAQGVFWFSSDPHKIANGESGAAAAKALMPVYLSAKKLAGWAEYEKYGLGELQSRGYDGIKLDDDYVVFEPTQIKSATGNRGTFDPKNPDIRFSPVAASPANWKEQPLGAGTAWASAGGARIVQVNPAAGYRVYDSSAHLLGVAKTQAQAQQIAERRERRDLSKTSR